MSSPLDRPDLGFQRNRDIQVFRRDEPTSPGEAPESPDIEEYDALLELSQRAEEIVDDLRIEGRALGVPIGEDDNEVRAAHLRLNGDGHLITFAEFREALDERSRAKADLFKADPTGNSFVDQRRLERVRLGRHINPRNFPNSGILSQLASFGTQGFILWAVNELLGAWKGPDTQKAVAGKQPPGVELPAIIQQIIQSMIMMRFVSGLSKRATESVAGLDTELTSQFDFRAAVDEAFSAPQPSSKSYEVYRASLAKADHELLVNHSLDYAAEHIGDGFEAWWAYLTAKETHEETLRDYDNGEPYRDGDIALSEDVRAVLRGRIEAGNKTFDLMGGGLGRTMASHETCCLLRAISVYDLDFLEMLQTIIRMACAVLQQQVRDTWSWYLRLANHPWNIISREIMRGIDLVFDKMVDKLTSGFDIGGPLEEILRECTPMNELIDTTVTMLEYLQGQFKKVVGLVHDEISQQSIAIGTGWDITWQLRRAKEILRSIDALIEEKRRSQQEEIPESAIDAIVGNVQGFLYEHRIPGYEQISDFQDFTQDAVEWCRSLGDWDALKDRVRQATT